MRKADKLYYEAEMEAGVALLGAFPSEQDAQAYVDHVLRQRWWIDFCGGVEHDVRVKYVRRVQTPGLSRRRGHFVMTLSLGRLHEGIALHELAHAPTYVPGRRHKDHGPAFIRAHMCLLEHMVDSSLVEHFRLALQRRGFVW